MVMRRLRMKLAGIAGTRSGGRKRMFIFSLEMGRVSNVLASKRYLLLTQNEDINNTQLHPLEHHWLRVMPW